MEIFFLTDLISKIWFVRFIEVKFHLGARISFHFTQVSALECPFIEVILWGFDQKTVGGKIFVRFSQVSVLAHDRFSQVLL